MGARDKLDFKRLGTVAVNGIINKYTSLHTCESGLAGKAMGVALDSGLNAGVGHFIKGTSFKTEQVIAQMLGEGLGTYVGLAINRRQREKSSLAYQVAKRASQPTSTNRYGLFNHAKLAQAKAWAEADLEFDTAIRPEGVQRAYRQYTRVTNGNIGRWQSQTQPTRLVVKGSTNSSGFWDVVNNINSHRAGLNALAYTVTHPIDTILIPTWHFMDDVEILAFGIDYDNQAAMRMSARINNLEQGVEALYTDIRYGNSQTRWYTLGKLTSTLFMGMIGGSVVSALGEGAEMATVFRG